MKIQHVRFLIQGENKKVIQDCGEKNGGKRGDTFRLTEGDRRHRRNGREMSGQAKTYSDFLFI